MTHRMDVVVKGVILNEDKILIVQRAADDEIGGGTWECVGGKVEFGEDLEPALVREIKEEAGLDVTVEKLLYATTFLIGATRQVVILTYLCHSTHQNVVLSEEHTDYRWSTQDQLKLLLTPEIIRDFEKNNVFSLLDIDSILG
ncbi:NUDIX hydrolase [Paenibacillus marinisediminis]